MQKSLFFAAALSAALCSSYALAQDASENSDNTAPDASIQTNDADKNAEISSALDKNSAAISEQQAKIDELYKQVADLQKQIDETKNSESSDKASNYFADHFRFGSYGRVQPSMNPDGMKSGRQTRLVAPTPRVDEGSYVELTLAYTPYKNDEGTVVDIVTTLALDGDKLFHYDGDWDAGLAIRNLYAEVRNLWFDGFSIWAGSRMYRGDDIYLLDMWPLDNLNTYGGGLGFYNGNSRTRIDVHFGTNRLKDDYQYEVVDTINERFVGKQDVVFLDRQRFISSLKLEQHWGGNTLPIFKLKLYGEVHAIGEGEYLETQPEKIKKLPSDYGWVVGAQLGISSFLDDSFVNLFIRYAAGLAAYGDASVPFGIDTNLKAANAKNFIAGLSAGFNFGNYADLLFGGYVRYFTDADDIEEDFDDGVEGVWDVRITGHIGQHFRPGIEFSQQLRHPNGLSPVNNKQELASLFKFSVLPAVRFGKGTGILDRPEIRFNYTLSVLNDAAQNIFPEKDELRSSKYVHFIGIAAEWWFNI